MGYSSPAAEATGSGSLFSMLPMLSIIAIIWLTIYLLPSIIALIKRNHRTKVILFNIFLGWTIVMWIISLVWTCKRDEETPFVIKAGLSPAEELMKYKELLDSGAISEEEYEEKKEQLLHL